MLHDDTLNRTTNGFGLASDFTFEEINKLDAGSFFYNFKTDIKIPSLKSTLDLVKENNKYLNIELKPNKNYEILNVEKVLQEINKVTYERIYFSSFDLLSCISLKKNSPDSLCGFLNDNFNKINIKETIDICKKYNLFCCGINIKYFSSDIADEFEKNNILVTIYSDKNISPEEAKNLWQNKVSSIFVDDPSDYFNFLASPQY